MSNSNLMRKTSTQSQGVVLGGTVWNGDLYLKTGKPIQRRGCYPEGPCIYITSYNNENMNEAPQRKKPILFYCLQQGEVVARIKGKKSSDIQQ